jgi:hypothetical protein
MRPIYKQVDLPETKRLNLDQAKAVLRFKPDIIFLEWPQDIKNSPVAFNKYPPLKKPKGLVKKIQKGLLKKDSLKKHPWAVADAVLFDNISKLWSEGHDVFLFPVDAQRELTAENYLLWKKMYPAVKKQWLWWVRIYLREKIMAENIERAFKKYTHKDKPKVLVLLQSFHWRHVRFLLSHPSKSRVWKYYFGRFSGITPKTIAGDIYKENRVFYKYWKKYADFH